MTTPDDREDDAAETWVHSVDPDPDPRMWPRPDEGRLRDSCTYNDALRAGAGPAWEAGADWATYQRRCAEDQYRADLDDEERREWAQIEWESRGGPEPADRYEILSWIVDTEEVDDRPQWERDLDGQPPLQEVHPDVVRPMGSVPSSIMPVGQEPAPLPAPACSHCGLDDVAVHRTKRWGKTWHDLCGRCRKYVIRTGQLPSRRLNYLHARQLGQLDWPDLDEAA